MSTITDLFRVDPNCVAECVHEAHMQLDPSREQITLDFSSLLRITAEDLRAMEELVDRADNQSIKVMLCGVNVDIYKVLKLVKLAPRFSFASGDATPTEAQKEESSHAEATD